MGDDYRPGKPQFWKLWAIGPPLCVVLAIGLLYGSRPWRIFFDLVEYLGIWLSYIGSKDENSAYKENKEKEKERKKMEKECQKMEKKTKREQKEAKKAEGKKRDEEQGGGDNKY
jgi:hypothetical protein